MPARLSMAMYVSRFTATITKQWLTCASVPWIPESISLGRLTSRLTRTKILNTCHNAIMAQQQLPDFTQAGRHFAQASDELEQHFQRMNNSPRATLALITDQPDLIRQSSDLIQAGFGCLFLPHILEESLKQKNMSRENVAFMILWRMVMATPGFSLCWRTFLRCIRSLVPKTPQLYHFVQASEFQITSSVLKAVQQAA